MNFSKKLNIVGIAAVASQFLLPFNSLAKNNEKPNFIIIMADDMGYGDIGCFGNQVIKTPNLDKMANEGMLLRDYHTNGAASTPTRCAMMTGRYQQRAGMQGVLLTWVEQHEKAGLQPEEVTFADVLTKNGYHTGLFGKWHLGRLSKYSPINHGFNEFRGFLTGNVDYQNYVDTQGRYDWWKRDSLERSGGYLTEVITQSGLDFIDRNGDEPFCLFLSHGCPHFPYQGPDDPGFRIEGKPLMHQSPRNDRDVAYKEMIEYLDKCVGDVFTKLREKGLDKNTFVVFVSDNGPTGPGTAGDYRGEKGDVFEGGHRVPGILWMPRTIKAGSVCSQPVMGMDFFPTMLEMASIKYKNTDKPLDGVSIVPLMKGKKMKDRWMFWRNGKGKAVRYGNMKYLETTVGKKKNKHIATYLFNLQDDPYEKVNLLKSNKKEADTLRAKLAQWEKSVETDVPEQIGN